MQDQKQHWYYDFVRKEIAPLLPKFSPNVLEVGCGCGSTLVWLKEAGHAGHVSGIELNPESAETAFGRLDKVYQGDADLHLQNIPAESQDLVLCLDVLEHLQDPWQTLTRIYQLVRPGGSIIVSLPNIRHYRVTLPLLFNGQWNYSEAGILDKTHLRFFSRESALDMVSRAGFTPSELYSTYAWGGWDRWIDWCSMRLLNEFMTFQYLIRAEKTLASDTLIHGFFPKPNKAVTV